MRQRWQHGGRTLPVARYPEGASTATISICGCRTGGAGTTGAGSGPVNLNTASLEQLQTLPGVGPVLAQHVLDWRAAHGAFRSIEQLNDVPGIGGVKFAALKSLVAV